MGGFVSVAESLAGEGALGDCASFSGALVATSGSAMVELLVKRVNKG
jgi:hypothetical protein